VLNARPWASRSSRDGGDQRATAAVSGDTGAASDAAPSITKALVLTAANFLASRAPLPIGHAVAALLVLEDGRYIM
jgi:hypothetical protein